MSNGFTQEWLDQQVASGRLRVIDRDREADKRTSAGPLLAQAGDEVMGEARGAIAPVSRSAPHAERRSQKRALQTPSGSFARDEREGESPAARPIARPEQHLQITVAAFLDWALLPDYRWLHIPNGEKRNPVIAAILKAMGVKPGAADVLILCPNGRFIWIELKSEKGILSREQKGWRDWCQSIGAPWFCCRSIEDVMAACDDAGVILRVQVAA